MSHTREEKRAYWANHVKAWKESGETQRNYCLQQHLKPHQLTYWKQVFEPHSEPMPTATGFIPVQVASSPSQAQGLTVRLRGGVCIEGVHAGNLTATRALIEWLA